MTNVTTTYLEMTSAADLKPRLCADRHFAIREASVRQWPVNRFLYRYIGEHWGWTDKRRWADESWQAYVESLGLRTFIASHEARWLDITSCTGRTMTWRSPTSDWLRNLSGAASAARC